MVFQWHFNDLGWAGSAMTGWEMACNLKLAQLKPENAGMKDEHVLQIENLKKKQEQEGQEGQEACPLAFVARYAA